MTLRRRSLLLACSLISAACASGAPRSRAAQMPAEALTDSSTIRLRCEDPEGVLAGRALCVLRDMPRVAPTVR